MIRAGVGISEDVRTREAARAAADQAMAGGKLSRAQLGLVFATGDHSPGYREMLSVLAQRLGCDTIVGCSALGVVAGDTEIEGRAGLAVMALESDTLTARSFFIRDLDRPLAEVVEAIVSRLAGMPLSGSTLVLMLDPEAVAVTPFLTALDGRLPGVCIVGGGASAPGNDRSAFVMGNGEVATGAIAGVLLANARAVPGLSQSCLPVGAPLTVTRTHEKVILELDGGPALGLMHERFHCADVDALAKLGGRAFVGLPMHSGQTSFAHGEYLVRPIVGLYPDQGGLGLQEEVPVGTRVLFLLRASIQARDDLRRMLAELVRDLGGTRPGAMLYINCCARGQALHGYEGVDSAMIRHAVGEVPLIGWFSSFEIARPRGLSAMVSYTGVLVPIAEAAPSARAVRSCGRGGRAKKPFSRKAGRQEGEPESAEFRQDGGAS